MELRRAGVFLDEIGEIPQHLQVKLLRALEAKEILPIGSTTPRHIDVRVLAATNRDLKKEVDAGRFRGRFVLPPQHHGNSYPAVARTSRGHPLLLDFFIKRHNPELRK